MPRSLEFSDIAQALTGKSEVREQALVQPVQRHLDVIQVRYPQSSLTWSAPKQEWRHFAQSVLLLSGKAEAAFKGAHLSLSAPAMAWLPPGLLHHMEFSGGSSGHLLSVSEDWLVPAVRSLLDPEIPFRAIANTVHSVTLSDANMQDRVGQQFAILQAELTGNEPGARSVVAAQILTLLTTFSRLSNHELVHNGPNRAPGSVVYQRFLQLVELHFREHWTVKRYADSMGVSERRLEMATRRDSNHSPGQLIQRKLVSEACQRLAHSTLSIGEVAYGLGFKDPAYFNRFFKRHTGQSPGRWRQETREKEFKADDTFAAWP